MRCQLGYPPAFTSTDFAMIRTSLLTGLALSALATSALAAESAKVPSAPPEVMAEAPARAGLIAFKVSGVQPNADAVAVFESSPDANGSRARTIVVFGRKDGAFIPDFRNDKLIACSNCGQFHDDVFDVSLVKVVVGHIHIEQADSGEKQSSTTIDLARKSGAWRVASATRQTFDAGRGAPRDEKLKVPPSGLASEMDARWQYVPSYNAIVVNNKDGKFKFVHYYHSPDLVWKAAGPDCNPMDCKVLVQQQDGCISLVRDASLRNFAAGTPDPLDRKAALSKAMDGCSAAGSQACKEVNTDCNHGVL
ncbi:DUF4189 domain-containing protein [Bacillus sp. NP157]|nr:DUF4189 domain-containing protein [Bacillus sp. NP157]